MMHLEQNLTAAHLANWVGGSLHGDGTAEILRARSDSRLCRAGDLFIALRGQRTDGNRFVESAWKADASVCLADSALTRSTPPPGKALITASDPLFALQQAARRIRSEVKSLCVVGITGSNGKTTTTRMVASILRHWMGDAVLATEGNYNSDIGLPLTLMGLRKHHRFAVLEMGMNRIGEMALLAQMARPRIVVITNIGSAHVGMLGSRQAVAAEKRQVLINADADSTLVLGRDEDWKDFLLEDYPGKVRYYGEPDQAPPSAKDGVLVYRKRRYSLPLPGEHNRMNAMAAVETALALGAPEDSITAGLECLRPLPGRSELHNGAVTALCDWYNANPESLTAAFNLFNSITVAGRRIVVLGEMAELGDETESALRRAAGELLSLNPDAVFLFGETLSGVETALRGGGFGGKVRVDENINELKTALTAYMRSGDGVLIKGSRGSALERLETVLQSLDGTFKRREEA